MKKRSWLWIILSTLCFIILLITAFFVLISRDSIFNYFTNKYLDKIELNNGIDFSYSSISTGSLTEFKVSDLEVSKDSKTILKTSSVTIGTSIFDLVRLVLGSNDVSFLFRSDDLFLDYDVNTNSSIILDDKNLVSSPEVITESNVSDSESNLLINVLRRLNGVLQISNANIKLCLNNLDINISNLNLDLVFYKDLEIESIDTRFSDLKICSNESVISCLDCRISGHSLKGLTFSASNAVYDDFILKNIKMLINLDDDYINASLSLDDLIYKTKSDTICSEKVSVVFSYDKLNKKCIINPTSFNLKTTFYGFDSINLSDSIVSVSLSDDDNTDNSLSIISDISGNNSNDYIGTYSLNIDAYTKFKTFDDLLNLKNLSDGYLKINNIICASSNKNNSIWISTDDFDSFSSSLNFSNNLIGNIDYAIKSKESSVRLYLSNLKFSEYKPIFDIIEHYAGRFADSDSQIDGSIVFKGKPVLNDLNGRLSINLVGQNFVLSDVKQSVALSLEANASDNILSIDTLALSALGKRLSYSGIINLTNYFPEGKLVLQDSKTFSEIGKIVFNLDNDKLGYSFDAIFNLKENSFTGNGRVSFADSKNISSIITINTQYNSYILDALYNVINKEFTLKSGSSIFDAYFDNYELFLNGIIDDLPLYISETTILHLNSSIEAKYNFSSNDFCFNFTNLRIVVSDILDLCFGIKLDNNHTSISNLSVSYKNNLYDFDGSFDVFYKDIFSLVDFKSYDYEFISNFKRRNLDNHIIGTYTNHAFSLDIQLDIIKQFTMKLLGNMPDGFYADCSFGDFVFSAKYNDKIISIENAEGELYSLSFNDINFDIDLEQKFVTCSVKVLNSFENYYGFVEQGGILELKAQLDSLVVGALNLAGIDAEASFELSLKDAYLGDGYKFKDNTIDVTFSRSLIKLEGEIFNGYILPKDSYLDITIDSDFLFGFNVKGYYKDTFELLISDIYFPIDLIDQFINTPYYSTFGGTIEGNLLLNGSLSDPSFYGMLYSKAFNMGLLYIPGQELSIKDVVITASDHNFYISRTPVVGHSNIDGRYYNGNVSIDLSLGAFSLDLFDLKLDVLQNPIDLWIPIIVDDSTNIDIRGDVVGTLNFYYKNNQLGLDTDIKVDNANVSFDIENKPDWLGKDKDIVDFDVKLTSGKNLEFYYPNKDTAFMNFTVEEGDKVEILYDSSEQELTVNGAFDIKSGRISYVNNDFNITDGECRLSKNLDGEFDFNIDLLANIREYDYDGNRMDIYLSLYNANFDNINPHFTSYPSLTENEILQILISSVIPTKADRFTFTNVANVAVIAAKTAYSLGLVNQFEEYSLNKVMREALNFDVFTARSAILENILLDSISLQDDEISLLAKYLNGTSIFAGKYIGNNWFIRMTLLLRSSSNKDNLNNIGHLLSDDLNLDFEFSLEWDNPLGEFTLFTKPRELSIFDFLDTIGFSVTKRFSF